MTMSDTISILALLVACLAALYARWSAKAAHRTNQISLHQPQLEIYLELRKFQNNFTGFLAYPTKEELEQFYEKAVVMSEIYFSPEISKPIFALYGFCCGQLAFIEGYENEEGDVHIQKEMEEEFNELGNAAISGVLDVLKNKVKIYEQ